MPAKGGYGRRSSRYSEYTEADSDSGSESDTYSDTYSSREDEEAYGRRGSVKQKRHSFKNNGANKKNAGGYGGYQGYGSQGRAQPSPYGSNRAYPKLGSATRSAPRY